MAELLLLLFLIISTVTIQSYRSKPDFSEVPESDNFTCSEIIRWLGTEKHYSNKKKEVLFGLLASKNCEKEPVLLLKDISFGWSQQSDKRTFFSNPYVPEQRGFKKKCTSHDQYAVAFLSNYSINNNFSHFLHGLLRLFCALLDARIIVYDKATKKFEQTKEYSIWLDEYFRLSKEKRIWLEMFGGKIRHLSQTPTKGNCVSSSHLLYGSGCVRFLPPEKWFGYPGCRASNILPAFGEFIREKFSAPTAQDLVMVDEVVKYPMDPGLRVAFAVRAVGPKTGTRSISNLQEVQNLIKKTQHVRSSTENVTFEHLDVPSTVRYMAGVHIFVSVHGAGMTNMFFMNSGAAIVEIIPYPLCDCRSPDYFYGSGGYYHGSAVALGLRHYPYCVPANEVTWQEVPADLKPGSRCNWAHLHKVKSVYIEPPRFVNLMRNVERDLVVDGTITLTKPIINISPHANG